MSRDAADLRTSSAPEDRRIFALGTWLVSRLSMPALSGGASALSDVFMVSVYLPTANHGQGGSISASQPIKSLLNITVLFLHAFTARRHGAFADKLQIELANFLPLVGLARSKQDPVNNGHGAQYSHRICQPGPGPI